MMNYDRRAFFQLTVLFFFWGAITSLNDILIPHLKSLFSLNYTEAMLIQFCFFTAYFVMSYPSGKIIDRIGYKKGIVLGLVVTAFGALLFLPSSMLLSYPMFLTAFFILASGITVLQVAANPFVAIIGPPETASSRLNLTQAFNSLGTTIAPALGTLFILDQVTESHLEKAELVQMPYIIIAGFLFIYAIIMTGAKLPQIESQTTRQENQEYKSAWSFLHLRLGALAIFLYVGAEVAIASLLVNFIALPEIAGLESASAGHYVSYYWGSAMLGRFLGSAILQKVKSQKILAIYSSSVILLLLIAISSSGMLALFALIAIGFFNSVMFANIFTLSIHQLGTATSQASGILCMAIVGGAIVPILQGLLADGFGLQESYAINILCYAYILFFALSGYRKGLEQT